MFVYHGYKFFSLEIFKNELMSKIIDEKRNYSKFEKEQTKLFRGNQKPHVNKVLHSTIRSRLKNKVNKTRKAAVILKYKKQRNLLVKTNNECKRGYFDKLNVKTEIKPFWKTCQL